MMAGFQWILLAVVLGDIGRRLTGRLVLQLQVKFVIGSRAAMCASPSYAGIVQYM